jgi:hypothetical protein
VWYQYCSDIRNVEEKRTSNGKLRAASNELKEVASLSSGKLAHSL